jgi:hypothetical protein
VPDRDGTTCGTCLTLNPPGAPACVRCNSPLAARAEPTPQPPAGQLSAGQPFAGRPPAAGPAAPAPDPLVGAKRIGPGLAAGPTAAPGSSRAHAAPVQPPGYGLGEEPAPPPPPAPDAALARRVTVVGLVVVLAVLLVGAGALWLTRTDHLDSRDVAATIGAQLTERGGGPVTVDCPGDPRRRAGERFDCVATDSAGGRRTVQVTVLDDDGTYRWAITDGG